MSALLEPGISIKPKVDRIDIQNILIDLYGIKCLEINEMNGYDDLNFHVKVESIKSENQYLETINTDGYTLKIINSMDSKNPRIFQAQNEMLLHLGRNGICCPKPVRTIHGDYYVIKIFKSGLHIARLLEYVSGSILCQVPITNELFQQAGEFAAKLDKTLENYHHPLYEEENYKSIWCLESVPQILKFHFAIKEERRRRIVEEVVSDFKTRVLPMSSKLERGQIHGDFNEQNILVEQKHSGWFIKGVLDFGDSHFTCYLFELAITMTYMMLQGKSIRAGKYVLAGYNSVRRVPSEEFQLLRVCVAARLCQSLVLGAYSSLQDPGNDYILITSKPGWALLEELWSKPESDILELWKIQEE